MEVIVGKYLLFLIVLSAPCFGAGRPESAGDPGTLIVTANGEDFVRRGFTDRDGWGISFDHLYINLIDPTAYTPHGEEAVLAGSHWVDLAAGDADAMPVEIGRLESVRAANYQSLRFGLGRLEEGDFQGSSIVMIGRAVKDGTTLPFTIRLDEEMVFDGREGYVGDELKGLLAPGGVSEVEMTFHFDHIFGDQAASEDDHVNANSVGFAFFLPFVANGRVDVSQAEITREPAYERLVRAVWNLGHLGEGHCEVSGQSSAGEIVP
jgi:hypothetical protein